MQAVKPILAWTQNNRWLVLLAAFLLAAGATIGSLYFSQIKEFVPCELCWYQRVFMFPLPLILGIAGYRKDKSGYLPALILALIGLAIALYHLSIQGDPTAATTCGGTESCADEPTFWFSWLSIPLASVLTFGGISGLLSLLFISDNSAKIFGKTKK